MTKTVFKIIGYTMKTPNGDFMESCVFWVYANNEKEAMKKIKSYKIEKKFYQTLEVIEKEKDA